MSPLSAVCFVFLLVVCLLSSPVSAQNYSGTATCNYTTFQRAIAGNGVAENQGWLTINLTAASYVQPNTPGFAGSTYLSYPIIDMSGIRTFYDPPTSTTIERNNIIGIGENRTIYMTFDPTQDASGYPSDPGYSYRFDYTGITILVDSTTTPTVQFAEVNTNPSAQYSELALFATGEWMNASFQLQTCTSNYTVLEVVTPTGPTSPSDPAGGGAAVGDPSFTGFLGQHYQVHGMADTVYSILSDRMVQLNAMFVFLNEGQCPVVNGKPLTNCWSHPGSYFGSLALKTAEGDRLLVTAGSYTDGMTLTLNDQPLTTSLNLTGLSVSIDSQFRASVQAGLYRMVIENSDMFVNIAGIEVTDWRRLKDEVQPHGLLGQTWQGRHRTVATEGTVDDYAEANNELFGSQFLYSKFGKQ